MKTKIIEIVEVECPRCKMIHPAKKSDCRCSSQGTFYARVRCTGNTCDGMNGELWRWLHGPDRYVIGRVIDFHHPRKVTTLE